MISEATFNISIKEAIKLLKEINVFKGIGPKAFGIYSEDFKRICRKKKHIDIYNVIRDNLDYELLLFDDSFFQFSYNNNYLRFSFIQNPSIQYTKYDFLKICFPEDDFSSLSVEDIDALINENEFEQYLNEQEINSNLIYVRYDFDVKGYYPLLHSCSHLHIGLNENLRIPLSIVLTPLEFVIFCVKRCFYDVWKLHHGKFNINEFALILFNSKNKCPQIEDSAIWKAIEKNEIYIT